MSVGARYGTLLSEIQVEFVRLTGLGLFNFPTWYSAQLRALKGSMGQRFPSSRHEHEQILLDTLRATPPKP